MRNALAEAEPADRTVATPAFFGRRGLRRSPWRLWPALRIPSQGGAVERFEGRSSIAAFAMRLRLSPHDRRDADDPWWLLGEQGCRVVSIRTLDGAEAERPGRFWR